VPAQPAESGGWSPERDNAHRRRQCVHPAERLGRMEGFEMEMHRLVAFSDGVIAVIITIMVLDLKPPHDADLGSLKQVTPVLLSYVLSFVYVAIHSSLL
jgi:hypothetical protein